MKTIQSNSSKNKYPFLVGVAAGLLACAAVLGVAVLLVQKVPANSRDLRSSAGGDQTMFQNAVGKKAPDFALSDLEGNTVRLSDLRGKNVVLFFNEGAMCYPGCWNQIAAFGEDARFNNSGTAAFSVVVDQKHEWERIVSQLPKMAGARLLFDHSMEAARAYGVLSLPSSMHPGLFPGHTYVVIDGEGVIRYVLDDPTMAIHNDDIAEIINRQRQ